MSQRNKPQKLGYLIGGLQDGQRFPIVGRPPRIVGRDDQIFRRLAHKPFRTSGRIVHVYYLADVVLPDDANDRRNRLFALMRDRALSTEDVARLTYRSVGTVYSWRCGVRNVPASAIALIEAAAV